MLRKKALSVILAMLLLALAPGALAAPSSLLGKEMPDFYVTTLDGGAFTLSAALKEKELVLVNFWATWCPPCKLEFPFMERAYEAYGDKVAVVALSVDPGDGEEALRAYAEEMGITFSVAQGSGLANRLGIASYPTTFLVDRFGKVVFVHESAIMDTTLFTNLFDQFLGDGYTESKPTSARPSVAKDRYAILFYDYDTNKGVEGCAVAFCTDTECAVVESDALGTAAFVGTPQVYYIKILSLPDGYRLLFGGSEGVSGAEGDLYVLPLKKVVR